MDENGRHKFCPPREKVVRGLLGYPISVQPKIRPRMNVPVRRHHKGVQKVSAEL